MKNVNAWITKRSLYFPPAKISLSNCTRVPFFYQAEKTILPHKKINKTSAYKTRGIQNFEFTYRCLRGKVECSSDAFVGGCQLCLRQEVERAPDAESSRAPSRRSRRLPHVATLFCICILWAARAAFRPRAERSPVGRLEAIQTGSESSARVLPLFEYTCTIFKLKNIPIFWHESKKW